MYFDRNYLVINFVRNDTYVCRYNNLIVKVKFQIVKLINLMSNIDGKHNTETSKNISQKLFLTMYELKKFQ